ncbi:MAG TPA: calcium/sodium antiporter [Steroidobacteraceae bacterium]|nr:calcium/sodium antiporter [Steroidobacteraceae bacterium]
MTAVLLLAGLVALVAGAEALVRGASKLALSFGISSLVVGLTIVAMGTSAPEVAVSVGAATRGATDLAIGNVVGSNVLNVLFVLGASALVTPLLVAQQLIRQEVPLMIGASVLLFVLALDRSISILDGMLLVTLLVAYTGFLIWQSRRANAEFNAEANSEITTLTKGGWDDKLPAQLLLVSGGLGLLILGADWFVQGAVRVAVSLGVSELVIGLTVVAFGTSLPEIVTSLLAAVRGERDMAVGNVIGSNIFNILGCLGLSAIVAPMGIGITDAMLTFDLPVMIAVAVACLPIFFTGNLISRWEGAVFVAYYFAYTTYLILAAQQHEAIDTFGFVMSWVVMPLTTLTIAVISYRHYRTAAP